MLCVAKSATIQENAVQQRKNVPELLCYEEKLACKIIGVASNTFFPMYDHTPSLVALLIITTLPLLADVLTFQFHNIDEDDWNRRFSVTIQIAGKQYNRKSMTVSSVSMQ